MEIGEPSSHVDVVIEGANEITTHQSAEPEAQESHLSPELQSKLCEHMLAGDWGSLKTLLVNYPQAIWSPVTHNSGTVLHLAIATNQKISFLRKLLAFLSPNLLDILRMTTDEGDTALHHAASFGNLEAVELLVDKDPELPNFPNHDSWLPLHEAAKSAHREVYKYLLRRTRHDVDLSPFGGIHGIMLVRNLINHGFCDLALELVKKHTHLVAKSLELIACRPSNFLSSKNYNLAEKLALKGSTNASTIISQRFDLISQRFALISQRFGRFGLISQRFGTNASITLQILAAIWAIWAIGYAGGLVIFGGQLYAALVKKRVKTDEKVHEDSIELVKFICQRLQAINPDNAKGTFQKAAKAAARNGTHEIIKEIIMTYPKALFLNNDDGDIGIFHIAVKHRQHQVFDLIFRMSSQRNALLTRMDKDGNTILHIAATLPSSDRLNLVHGAALQMQRELMWYQEVEKLVPAWVKIASNNKDIESRTLFTEQHKDLVKEGESWVRETAKSCTIAATLIIGITFAAIIAVTGSTQITTAKNNNGYYITTHAKLFMYSNSISLVLSITSLLMFLSLLNAHYAEHDFLLYLPIILLGALILLILSILSLILTFGIIIFFSGPLLDWWPLLLLLVSYPILVFIFFAQLLPLLKTTYWRGIFHKQGKRLLF